MVIRNSLTFTSVRLGHLIVDLEVSRSNRGGGTIHFDKISGIDELQ